MSRDALGAADVDDATLARIAADSLGRTGPATLLDAEAVEVDYDLPAMTTAGRWWVSGHVDAGAGPEPFRVFCKHVQSWSRSPFFQFVPEEYRAFAEAQVVWQIEPLAYRSDLGDRLPAGLRMPRALAVVDLDEKSAAVWLEEIRIHEVPWDAERYAAAARLLGRLAASPVVAALDDIGQHDFTIDGYLQGRLRMQVLPMLADEGIWHHPLVAGAFDPELRGRLRAAADRVDEIGAELMAAPALVAHGDACPNNLLASPDHEGFVLIDYGFWGDRPAGFDLGQLLVGDVQIGKRSAADLDQLEEVCLDAYLAGLRDQGCDLPRHAVRRAHALQLLVFTGLSTLPFEFLDRPPTPELHALAAERAAIARFCLDLVDATA